MVDFLHGNDIGVVLLKLFFEKDLPVGLLHSDLGHIVKRLQITEIKREHIPMKVGKTRIFIAAGIFLGVFGFDVFDLTLEKRRLASHVSEPRILFLALVKVRDFAAGFLPGGLPPGAALGLRPRVSLLLEVEDALVVAGLF